MELHKCVRSLAPLTRSQLVHSTKFFKNDKTSVVFTVVKCD